MPSSLQLNLFVPQPDPLTKEQLFSEKKRKEMQWVLSDEEYDFYKKHTRFVSYKELLWKLAQMKDWLNENISDWSKTAFFIPYWKIKSNHRITEHFYNNLSKCVHTTTLNNMKLRDYKTIIIGDDAVASWRQLEQLLSFISTTHKNSLKQDLSIILAIPFFTLNGFQSLKDNWIKTSWFNIIIPDIIDYIPTFDTYNNHIIEKLEDISRFDRKEYRWLFVFEHKKPDDQPSIPHQLYNIIPSIKEPYKQTL